MNIRFVLFYVWSLLFIHTYYAQQLYKTKIVAVVVVVYSQLNLLLVEPDKEDFVDSKKETL